MFIEKLNEVLSSRKSFISDSINRSGFGLAILLNIIHWAILYIKIKPDSTDRVLQYNIIYGAEIVGKSWYIFFIPLLALVIIGVNLILGSVFYNKEKLATHFLAIATVVVQIIFLVASLVLININA